MIQIIKTKQRKGGIDQVTLPLLIQTSDELFILLLILQSSCFLFISLFIFFLPDRQLRKDARVPVRGDLLAGGWGARGAWQFWPCCAGLSGMLLAEVRTQSQLPVGTLGLMGIRGPRGGEGCLQVLQLLWGASGSQLSARAGTGALSGQGPPGLAWGKELGSAVATSAGHQRVLEFLLHAYFAEDCRRGCPILAYRCFAERLVSFWSCTCICTHIYT